MWLSHWSRVKFGQNMYSEEIDTERSRGKNDGFWLLGRYKINPGDLADLKYLRSKSNKILFCSG